MSTTLQTARSLRNRKNGKKVMSQPSLLLCRNRFNLPKTPCPTLPYCSLPQAPQNLTKAISVEQQQSHRKLFHQPSTLDCSDPDNSANREIATQPEQRQNCEDSSPSPILPQPAQCVLECTFIFEAKERPPGPRRKKKTAGQKILHFKEMEDDVLLEEAKRRNALISLATSSLLNLQGTMAVQQESKAKQCLMHQSQAEASMMAAELYHPWSNQSDSENPPELQYLRRKKKLHPCINHNQKQS